MSIPGPAIRLSHRRAAISGPHRLQGETMPHPVIHAEIRSSDPDASRAFYSELFGWTYAEGALPGYTFVDPGVEGALQTAIGPLQGGSSAVLFFVGVEDVAGTLARAEQLGGRVVQPAQ